MSADFDWAEEAEELAQPIIEQHHRHLVNARVLFVFTDEAMKSNGRRVLAKASKVTGFARFLSEATDEEPDFVGNRRPADFRILISKPYWDEMGEDKRIALLDHELCHLVRRDDKWALREHTVEEFAEIVERHGLWKSDLEAFGRTVQQLSLPLFADARAER